MRGLREVASPLWVVSIGVATIVGAVIAAYTIDSETWRLLSLFAIVGIPLLAAAFRVGQLNASSDGLDAITSWDGSGIEAVLRREEQTAQRPLSLLMGSATAEVLINGITLAQTRPQVERIKARMALGCKFYLLLPDPRSNSRGIANLAELAGWNRQVGPDLLASLEAFKEVWFKAERGYFQVAVHSRANTCSFIVIDNKYCNVDFFLREVGSPNRLSLRAGPGDLLIQVRQHWDYLWTEATLLDSVDLFDEVIAAAKNMYDVS